MKNKNYTFRWIEVREFTGLGEDTPESKKFYKDMVDKAQVTGTVIKRMVLPEEKK